MNRLRIRALAFAALLGFVAALGTSASAQETAQIEGVVSVMGANGQETPVEGALVEIYRTDMGTGSWKLKTDKRGRYVFLGAPIRATVTITLSGPGLAPMFRSGLPVSQLSAQVPMKWVLTPGAGNRFTLEEIKAAGSSTNAAPKMSAEEAAKIAAANAEITAKNEKITANKGLFDEKKARFDAAIAALSSKNYESTISELSAVLQGLDQADPEIFNEMIQKSASNLSEAQYQQAVSLFNAGNKEGAKTLLESADRNIARAIAIAPTEVVYYQIQGKTGLLLIERFNTSDRTDATGAAYDKVIAGELDPASKKKLMLKRADAYRFGYRAELNGAYDEAKANAYKAKALAAYKQILAEDPKNPDAMYGIALTMFVSPDIKDYQTAADYMKLMVDTAPSDPRAPELQKNLDQLAAMKPAIKPRPVK